MKNLKYWFYGVSFAGVVTLWKHGGEAGFIALFVWAAGFLLGANYQRNHPNQ